MRTPAILLLTAALLPLSPINHAFAERIYVPNASFESPLVTDFDTDVNTNMISWGTFPAQTFGAIGVFGNLPGDGEFITNCDGNQAAYVFNDPGLVLFQDYSAVDSTGAASTAFASAFEPGHTYKLVTGFVVSTNFGALPGATLQMSLYYRDASSNMVTIASTNIVYDTTVFTTDTALIDFELDLPAVKLGDAWAGKHIGIQFASTVSPDLAGGFWDVDNVRLSSAIYVPNYSFELPLVTDFTTDVNTNMVSWATFPPQTDGAIGVFGNFPGPEFISNADGNQCAYLFNNPGLALFQDYEAVDSTGAPSTNFTATYEAGKSYQLTTGFLGNTNFGTLPGASLQMSLYYRDGSSNIVVIAATNIIYDTNIFTSITNLVDFTVVTPPVKPTDPWLGQHIGIQFLSNVDPDLTGGFWDMDNVRLSETLAPVLNSATIAGGNLAFTVDSDPGSVLEILAATNIATPTSAWSNIGTITNSSGMNTFTDSSSLGAARFYQAVQIQP